MNIFVIISKSQKALFKHIAADDVSVIEFCFFRSCWLLLATCLKFACKRQNPFSNFLPKGARRDMFVRSLSGQLTFALENLSFTMIPISTAFIMIGVTPFWVVMLAVCILGDSILDIEVIGIMIVSFGLFLITFSWYKIVEEQDEEAIAEGKQVFESTEI